MERNEVGAAMPRSRRERRRPGDNGSTAMPRPREERRSRNDGTAAMPRPGGAALAAADLLAGVGAALIAVTAFLAGRLP
jgi:hypothetical protein